MGRDGICRVKDGTYSKTIRFNDINYQLAQNEDKNAIFEGWCDFLNYFDTNAFFATKDDIIISDPEGEYYPLVQALGGQVIHISATSKDYVNPMDINMDYSDDDEPLGVKSEFILSLCELVMGSKNGIEPEEKSVIDRCLPLVYQKYFLDPIPLNMPVLGDLYQCLRKQNEPKAQRIATALEIYVNGSLKVFNHRTSQIKKNK